jgi:hypothetical protein
MSVRCASCGAGIDPAIGRIRHRSTRQRPSYATMERWERERGGCEATDGCWVEPDGHCEHGHQSWQLRLGLV